MAKSSTATRFQVPSFPSFVNTASYLAPCRVPLPTHLTDAGLSPPCRSRLLRRWGAFHNNSGTRLASPSWPHRNGDKPHITGTTSCSSMWWSSQARVVLARVNAATFALWRRKASRRDNSPAAPVPKVSVLLRSTYEQIPFALAQSKFQRRFSHIFPFLCFSGEGRKATTRFVVQLQRQQRETGESTAADEED